MSGASPWLQWRVGKWVANHRSDPDPDGRVYDPYNDGPATPLFHLGHGLSFTSFDMSNLTVTPMPRGPTVLAISLSVRNTGTRAGAHVVQAYAIDPICEYAPLFNTCTPCSSLLRGVKDCAAPQVRATLEAAACFPARGARPGREPCGAD